MSALKEMIIKHKKILFVALGALALVIVLPGLFGGFGAPEAEVAKPVRVMTVVETEAPLVSQYIGLVESASRTNAAFKMSGKMGQVFVKEGDAVKAGQILASLETTDLTRAYQSSENNLKAAKEAYEFLADQYEKLRTLQEAGGLSAQELEKSRIELESRSANYQNTRLDFESKAGLLNDASIRSEFDGYVSRILFKEGEVVPAGQPAIIVHSTENQITTGISPKDSSLITRETRVDVSFLGNEYPASIIAINSIPDPATRTYQVTLALNEASAAASLQVGSLVSLFFETSQQPGIFLPLSIISNDGRDYVFVVDQDNRVVKKTIILGQVRNKEVLVQGLQDGDRVVVEGYRNVTPGGLVSIQE